MKALVYIESKELHCDELVVPNWVKSAADALSILQNNYANCLNVIAIEIRHNSGIILASDYRM